MLPVILNEWLQPFTAFWNSHWSDVIQFYLAFTWLMTTETAAILVYVLCTPYNHAPAYSVNYLKLQTYGVCCLAVTCHLLFWQNDQDPFYILLWQHRGGTDTEIRVNAESWLWRRKFSYHSCGDSNTQPFNHNCGTLPLGLPLTHKYASLMH